MIPLVNTKSMVSEPTWQVLCGDARAKLADLEENSVQVFVTSVPYWSLRRYVDDDTEIGREDSVKEWIDNLVDVFRAARTPLRSDGVVWINCGDVYASQPSWGRGNGSTLDGGTPYSAGVKRNLSTLKPKDLFGLPYHLAFALQADGWYWRSAIPWIKGVDWLDNELQAQQDVRQTLQTVRETVAGSLFGLSDDLDKALRQAEKAVDRLLMCGPAMPESITDRPTSSYEMLLLFSQSPHYFYDHNAIKLQASTSTNSSGNGSRLKEGEEDSQIRAKRSFHETTPHAVSARNARNVWMIPWRINPDPKGAFVLASGKEVAHFAAFPEELPARAILASTSEAGCCALCHAPFERIVSPTPEYAQHLGHDWADYDQDQEDGRGHFDGASQRPVKRNAPGLTAEYITLGWAPTCTCYGEPVEGEIAWPRKPCVVGDMFAGSGTTGRAALQLGRSAVLIDLHPDYCELMNERLALFPGDVQQARTSRPREKETEDEQAIQFSMFDSDDP